MIVVANWKMNLNFNKSLELASKYIELYSPSYMKIIVLASDLVLQDLAIKFKGSGISVFAQDCSRFEGEGSYTGEISALQLKKVGVKGVLIGHIERRLLLKENDEIIAQKLINALASDIDVILNIGETDPKISFLESLKLFEKQLRALNDIDAQLLKNRLIIAYESAGGISSLRSSSEKDDDIDMIESKGEFIRTWLDRKYPDIKIPLLYGGSLDKKELMDLKDRNVFDGFLIGRNSLNFNKFRSLVTALSY